MRPSAAAILAVVAVGFTMSGCAKKLNMEKHYQNYRTMLLNEDYQSALKYIEGKKEGFYGEKNRLLYYMEKGTVLGLGNRYKESNEVLEQAKTAAQELWTKSIKDEAKAWLTTDNSVAYQGEDFEKVMIHFVAASNYMALQDYSAARVEARQITNRLELYNQKYEEMGSDFAGKYKDDAFARWLAGMLAETGDDQSALNDAWIDYKKAIAVYRNDYAKRYKTLLPKMLLADALRALEGLGSDFQDEYDELRTAFPGAAYPSFEETKDKAKVVFIHNAGEAPYKKDMFWKTRTAKGKIIRVAYPVFVRRNNSIVSARIKVNGVATKAEMAQDISSIAIKNLGDRMAAIKAKAIARALLKLGISEGAEAAGKKVAKKNKAAGTAMQIGGALFNLGTSLAEQADKRAWASLPSRINVAHAYVEPGPLTVEVEYLSANGAVVKRETLNAEATAGKTVFLVERTFR